MSLNEQIDSEASMRLQCRFKNNMDDDDTGKYNLYLTYLTETWKNDIINEYDNVISRALLNDLLWHNGGDDEIQNKYKELKKNYDGTFEYISKCFDDGTYYPEFNNEWLDDIFERNILDSILK